LHGSVIIQLKDQEIAEKAIKFRLFLGGISVKPEKYRHQAIQYQKCQKFGHLARECRLNHKYQIYTEEHPTKASAGMAQWLRRLARKPARDLASSVGCIFETHS